MDRSDTTRRHYLRAVGLTAIASLAGCSSNGGDQSGGTGTDDQPTATGTPGTDTLTPTATLTPTTTTAGSTATPTQQAKLTADSPSSSDTFGEVVAVSGDGSTAIVGNQGADVNGTQSGSIHVFDKSEGTWSQQAELTPDDADEFDGFGDSVSLSADGSAALIGTPTDEDPNGTGAGAAYVFEESNGTWSQTAKLTATDGDGEDGFGISVAVTDDGATGVIGASGDGDPNGSGAGSAYVFTSANGTWTQQAKLSADDGDDGDDFGVSVAVAGDGSAAVVGAPNDEDPNGSAAGAAYAFTPSDGTWTQQGKLTADDGDAKDRVGVSVAISDDGTTAIIGAPNDEDPNGKKYSGADTFRSGAGAAYVFTASDGAWSQATKLAPDDGDAHDDFGTSVAISGDGATGIVGAFNDENPNGANEYNNGAGSAYVFRSSSESWSQAAKLAPADGDIGDNFGASVAASNTGTTALISAPNDDGPSTENVGSAYVYSI